MKLQISQKAPDFSAIDQVGKRHSLSDYRGQYLLLYFYPKDDTPGCTTEACSFRDSHEDLLKYTNIIGVSSDSVKSHEAFAQKYKLLFPLLSDEEKKIARDYGVDGLIFTNRSSFLIDGDGVIVKIYNNVDPDTHTQNVLRDLQNLHI